MADVDNLRLRRDFEMTPFMAPMKLIVKSEVGGESDDRDARQSLPREC